MIPVCSPEYLSEHSPLLVPADVLDHTLLLTTTRLDNWSDWRASAGVADAAPTKKITLEGDGLSYRAAVAGLGIVSNFSSRT